MSTFNHIANCPDCQKALHAEEYINWRGEKSITLTCTTKGCALNSVTLSPNEWITKNLDAYRLINAKR